MKFELNSLIIGIISGIVSSVIIYLLVFQVKPKIKISENIARYTNENGDNIYKIKVINKSFFAVFNLSYSLHYCHRQPDGIIHIIEIEPLKSSLFYISQKCFFDKDNKHAVRISYNIDKDKYPLDENSYLKFTIIATHSFTNTTSYKEATYNRDDIIDGMFETGDSMKVLSVSAPSPHGLILHKNFNNTKTAAEQGNAEERTNTNCEISK